MSKEYWEKPCDGLHVVEGHWNYAIDILGLLQSLQKWYRLIVFKFLCVWIILSICFQGMSDIYSIDYLQRVLKIVCTANLNTVKSIAGIRGVFLDKHISVPNILFNFRRHIIKGLTFRRLKIGVQQMDFQGFSFVYHSNEKRPSQCSFENMHSRSKSSSSCNIVRQ